MWCSAGSGGISRTVHLHRPKPTYANVVSSLALFVALGGTSYAVARSSVGSAQLRANAVTSVKVKNRSLRANDLSPSARLGIGRGPQGKPGPPGQFIGTPEAWKPLELASGWAAFDANHPQPGFRKDRQGLVHLRGLLTLTAGVPPAAAGDITLATLPVGYRPSLRTIFAISTGQGIAFARLIVDPDGTLKRNSAVDVAEQDYTSLNGVTFWPD
jgi:hypothetical protein